MNTFASLKQARKSQFDKLTSELNKLSSKSDDNSSKDDGYWKPVVDKAGNGSAVIRFLPAPIGEDVPFIRYWTHGFQGPGGWYIENSLSSIGKPDPVMELNGKLWNSGIESNKDIARKQKRNLHFVSNIYVVKDPANPENEGKVFLFKYGQKIFEKINAKMHPEFEDETPVNPFDLWTGCNFRMKVVMKGGFWNYDASKFDDVSVLGGFDDEKLEEIYNQQHSLQELISGDNIKSFDELQARLDRVLRRPSSVAGPRASRVDEETSESESAWSNVVEDSDDESDNLSYFARLAEMSN